MNFRNSLAAVAATAVFLASTAGAFASSGTSQCQIIYGGGQVCQDQIKFTVDKKVQQPTKGGGYVDNMSNNDTRFQPGNDVAFQITITNTGNTTISNLTVVDTLPSNLTFVSGAGNYNSSNNTITYTINNLEAGKSNQQTFVARIADGSKFSQAVTCLTNSVVANDNNGNSASDKAGLCVENKITTAPQPKVFTTVPPKSIPSTGPELLALVGLLPLGATGLYLRKKSRLS
jgi:uncharacterized repeat protein (TIGR01451 family)